MTAIMTLKIMAMIRDDLMYVAIPAVMIRNTNCEAPMGICSKSDLKLEYPKPSMIMAENCIHVSNSFTGPDRRNPLTLVSPPLQRLTQKV